MPVEIGDICKRGHEIAGDNIQHYMNRGSQRVRCAACNQPPKQMSRKPGDTCKNGHSMDGDNLGERVTNGKVQYFCKECKRVAVRKYNKTPAGKEADRRKVRDDVAIKERRTARKVAERADQLIIEGKDDSALSYLRLARRAERWAGALQDAMAENAPNCGDNPGPYIDYDEDNPPSADQAFKMCEDCPVLVQCARFASAYKPPIGVWGGEVWKDGTILYK